MLRTALVEDLNLLACADAQARYADDQSRAREALDSLRWIDTTQIDRYAQEGWLERNEVDIIERVCSFAAERLVAIPPQADPIEFTRADPNWYAVRERALEALIALDAFIDLDVPGWGVQYASGGRG
jgi:hypothetical protein